MVAKDAGGGPGSLSSSASLTVYLEDRNDQAPVFSNDQYELSVYETESAHSLVGQITATDLDEGANARIYYSILSGGQGAFYIDTITGAILFTLKGSSTLMRLRTILTVAINEPACFKFWDFFSYKVKSIIFCKMRLM